MREIKNFKKNNQDNIYKVNFTWKGKREYKILKAKNAGQAEENMLNLNKAARNIHAEIIDGRKEI
ncbi:hypothetical protein SAMN05192534_1269 [Alteribacillus persepolensis]|uniref:Uncharacterized protein n=1 Tax=Alteribacillus persepolensis TaxID=568899 RepID=A0A1G8IT79_9BACI|nr:hypothetical protein [Alteribacillus persepolensis]SDI22139.1 hypothetical protein SAMN05192534_1269 [Alteribacillus persepolensis]